MNYKIGYEAAHITEVNGRYGYIKIQLSQDVKKKQKLVVPTTGDFDDNRTHAISSRTSFDCCRSVSGGWLAKEDLILRSSDLTDLGNQFFKEVSPKWSAYIDRGGDIQKTTLLQKGLNKLTQFNES